MDRSKVGMFVSVCAMLLVFNSFVAADDSNTVNATEEQVAESELKGGARSSNAMAKGEYIVYGGATALSLPLGYVVLKIKSAEGKMWANLGFGLLLATMAAGWHILQSIFMSSVVFLLVRFAPQSIQPHTIAFFFCMVYLLFYRTCQFTFPEWPRKSGPSNAMMMILSYRTVSVAFDVRASPLTNNGVVEPVLPQPSMLRYFSYIFSFVGLIVGPVITFKDFHNYIELNPNSMNDNNVKALFSRGKKFLAWAGVFVLLKIYVPSAPLQELLTGWRGWENALELVYKLAWGCYLLRFQYYAVWAMGEQGAILMGIGSTKNGGYEEEQISNIEPLEIEVYSWARDSENRYPITHIVRNWNMGIQRWLVRYVFKRFPVRSLRTIVVFIVSAYMHGISVGFYAFFVHLAIFDYATKRWQNMAWSPPFKSVAPLRWLYLLMHYNLVYRLVEYFVFSFHMPSSDLNDLWTIYNTLGYFGHIGTFLMIAITFVVPQKKSELKRVYSENMLAPKKQN